MKISSGACFILALLFVALGHPFIATCLLIAAFLGGIGTA